MTGSVPFHRLAMVVCAAVGALPSMTATAQTTSFTTLNQLTAAQQAQIAAAQQEALTAVDNALTYLRSNAVYGVRGLNSAYNQNLGQFFDNSSANPLLGQYSNTRAYAAATLNPIAVGTSTTSGFTPTGTVRQTFWKMTSTGTLDDPNAGAFIHDDSDLYGNAKYMPLSSLSTSRASVSIPSGGSSGSEFQIKDPNGTSSTGSSSNLPIYNLTRAVYNTAPIPPSITANNGPVIPSLGSPAPAYLHGIERTGQALDARRYGEVISLLTQIRTALAGTVTYTGNLYASGTGAGTVGANAAANRTAVFNALNTGTGTSNRGFQEYGYSTSDSLPRQARDIARLTNPSLDLLRWFEDTGARDANNNLLPGQRDRFFEDKFGLLFTGGTMYIGRSALNGVEQVNNGIFDSTKRDGQYQRTPALYQRLIEAFATGLTQGGRTTQFGLNQINAANGNVNTQTSTTGATTFFPQDRDVRSISNFVSAVRNTNPAIPVGKVGIVSRAMSPVFSSTSIIVPIQ